MKNIIIIALTSIIIFSGASAQIPVEIFAGEKKTSFDLMFFKFFKNKEEANSKLLFYNRNRVNFDYKQTSSTYLPVSVSPKHSLTIIQS